MAGISFLFVVVVVVVIRGENARGFFTVRTLNNYQLVSLFETAASISG